MENIKSKLIKPLFDGMNFNYSGKRMRAVFVREISNGEFSYRLWHKAGIPDRAYPSADNDKYLLYVERNDYLIPLGMTDFFLINNCAYEIAIKELYGNRVERRNQYEKVRSIGEEEALKFLEHEQEMINLRGSDPVLQFEYIDSKLKYHVETYLESKKNNGKTFPDFVGAAMMNELEICKSLSATYKEIRMNERKAQIEAAQKELEKKIQAGNMRVEDQIKKAIHILRHGGTINNHEITIYSNDGSGKTYHLINYLMRKFAINVPLRTQGWINEKLIEVNVNCENGNRQTSIRFLKRKNSSCPQSIFEYLGKLFDKIQEE